MDFCVNVALHKIKHAELLSDNSHENIVISPLGICVILNMIAFGAKGSTLEQILGYLKLQSAHDLISQASKLMELAKSSNSDDDNLVICNFNALLVKNTVSLTKFYLDFLENVYQTKVKYVDFLRKNEAVHEVNAWVEQETEGLIKQLLLDGAFESPRLILSHANALYFKGSWDNEFSKSNSSLEKFYLLDGNNKTVDVPFMKNFDSFYDYCSFDDFDVLKLPYKRTTNPNCSRRFSMLIVLPIARKGLPNLVYKFRENPHLLSSEHLMLQNKMISSLYVPRFKITYSFEPSNDIQELGLRLPFEANGELNGVVEGKHFPIKVSKITQHSHIECNEKGTEVVTCTYASEEEQCGFNNGHSPPQDIDFIVDHPFMFTIKEDVTDAIFFLGAIFNPLNKEDE